MNPVDFIYENIKKILENEGDSKKIASAGACAGVDEYRRRASYKYSSVTNL